MISSQEDIILVDTSDEETGNSRDTVDSSSVIISKLQKRIKELESENRQLNIENVDLKTKLGGQEEPKTKLPSTSKQVVNKLSLMFELPNYVVE